MSKIGKKPIVIPEGVTVTFADQVVTVKGPKGELTQDVVAGVDVAVADEVTVTVASDDMSNFWGLYRTLISNMIEGVTKGYEKKLLLIGVGYNAQVQGNKIKMNLGYSHPIEVEIPSVITATAEQDPKGNPVLSLSSIDKQFLGQFAAQLRDLRKPEPYKGKGVRYIDEVVKIKPGKSAK